MKRRYESLANERGGPCPGLYRQERRGVSPTSVRQCMNLPHFVTCLKDWRGKGLM